MSIRDHKMYELIERERRSLNQIPYYCRLVKQLPNGTQFYKIGIWIFSVTVIVLKENGLWHLSISGKRKLPSPRQIFIAQSVLIPLDVEMEMLPRTGLDPYCVNFVQVPSTRGEAIKWLEQCGYARYISIEDNVDTWVKGSCHIPYAYLPGESSAALASIRTLPDFREYVINTEHEARKFQNYLTSTSNEGKSQILINANRIEFILQDLMYREDELVNGKPSNEPVIVEAIRATFGLHPDRLAVHKPEIESFLNELNDNFTKGQSFLELIYTRSGEQWTDLHEKAEKLMVLGIAIKRLSYCAPKEMWSSLPGGLPYLVLHPDEKSN